MRIVAMKRCPPFAVAVLARALLLAATLLPSLGGAQRRAQPRAQPTGGADSAAFAQLRFRHIGPEGNRVSAVAGVPGDPDTYYAGAASGGIWKTTDGGVHWQPVFDDHPVQSIGALAVAPSDPNVVWAGTGEAWIRSNISLGWGVYKSTDAGKTWTRVGLESSGRISRIVVDPRDPDVVFAAVLGHAYGPQPERGVYRTRDGGKSWERVLFVNDSTGASDVIMDPNNPRVLFAGTWQVEIHTWGRESGGAGSGLWTSRDGGTTWTRLTGNGLPTRPIGKVGLGMSRSNSNRVYALIETGDGVPWNGRPTDAGRLFRSDDGGTNWKLVSHDRQVAGRTHYYNRMGVSPDNPDEAYFLTASWAKTLDGGATIIDPPLAETPGGDHHDIWIDPTNGNRMIVSHDGGASISTNRGRGWLQVQLPIAQIYHATVDNRVPYNVYGNRQDGPSTMGPSNSRIPGFDGFEIGIPRGMWRSVGGGESGWATPDPVDSNVVWSTASGYGSVGGIVSRYDMRTGVAQSVEVWPQATIGWPADSLKYRFVWTFPLTISPHDHNTVYVGSQHVHATTDSGRSWRVISPDLTRNDKKRQRISGGLTPDNIGVEYAGVVFAIAESPRERGLIWAGTNDGLVHLTRDGGKTWTNVTANVPRLLAWGTISNIEPSRYDAGTAYLTVDGHQVNNRDPWVYKTTDYGKSWTLITTGIPRTPLSYAHIVREDPAQRGLLYLGTENGLYVSFDDGGRWQPLQSNLPHAPVYGLAVQENYGDLVVATYGRGFWILDDLSPLRQYTREVASRPAHLFAPRPVYRLRDAEAPMAAAYDPVVGQNPPYGAPINYWLRTGGRDSAATDSLARRAPVQDTLGRVAGRDSTARDTTRADSVTLAILDASGKVVRTMKGPAKAGVNRAWWDLRFDRSKEARLRTSPLYAPWVSVKAEGLPAPGVGRYAILAPPGRYTVRLTARGQDLTAPIEVRRDPNAGGSDDEIRQQMELATAIQADLNDAVDAINNIETVRAQLASLKEVLKADTTAGDVRATADSLDRKLVAAEERLLQVRVTGRGQDLLRWPMRISEQLVYLAQSVGGSDRAPTGPQREVHQLLREQLRSTRGQLDQLLQRDVASFNEMLRKKKLDNIIAAR